MWYLLNNTKGWSIQRDNNILDQFYSTVLVLPVQLLFVEPQLLQFLYMGIPNYCIQRQINEPAKTRSLCYLSTRSQDKEQKKRHTYRSFRLHTFGYLPSLTFILIAPLVLESKERKYLYWFLEKTSLEKTLIIIPNTRQVTRYST